MTKAALKSLFIGIVLVVLEEFSGCYLLLYRAGSFFDQIHGVPSNIASMVIGFIQVVGAYVSTLMVERIGRKCLIINSTIGIVCGMLLAGFTIPLINESSLLISMLPVIGLSISLFSANVGIFILSFVILAEITPTKVR